MALRVTQNMLNSNMLRNLHKSMLNMDKMQQQLASGRKINLPSDDPVVATRGMFYRSSQMENDQYKRNASEAMSWMDLTDKTLDEVGNVMKRVSELLVYSGNGATSPDDLKTMGAEIAELKKHLGTLANQTINGKYIFAGTETDKAPYDENANGGKGDFINKNSSEVLLELSQNVFAAANINAQKIFNYPDNAGNMFKVLDNIIEELNNGRSAAQFQDEISQQYDNLLAERATLGARVNRIELIGERLNVQEVNIKELMSKNEDADIAEVITNLKTQEGVHRSALGAGARIIQPTLLDFLR
ncbi:MULTISPECIES: flagellar hook-associated protein FlgL [Brevibacillus]|uniref:Flagellar hook-associated protein 3 n=1 Tax=Brevibacillus borstelensis AK1 TaxID=1300222 RepID=M8D7N6_9BACL|nr:flagellar hook-associated protein FlgL [Brevibacillus borstelensis]EMT52259.1 flagellar hook-associated protein 3 [Brevibacillus borstelensis AK1]KKX54705.1 flagellar hook protein FlgL [Brevibacillus borstelensis cifa_chp40]MCM3590164.1 flagellar hook-associated protein FlgL [Brevibacillus borstelensis]MED1881767.1 flagellar hook-associated protein FlgL [Brevibacillus borstelensis]MED2007460.1 flagellar hook-associated protein FlgL [Brevibacillus borstelensis]